MAGGGGAKPATCPTTQVLCMMSKEVQQTCDPCSMLDCGLQPDFHVSCGNGTCVPQGQTCPGAGGSGGSGGAAGSGGGKAGASGGVGSTCGGKIGGTCPDGTYCVWPDKSCGVADGVGTCQMKQGSCPPMAFQGSVCGCDGKVYVNACDAGNSGVDTVLGGFCTMPADTFKCGDHFCDLATTYCRKSLSDIGGVADTYQCQPLPAACAAATSCTCLAGEACGSSCAKGADGGFTLTCPGG